MHQRQSRPLPDHRHLHAERLPLINASPSVATMQKETRAPLSGWLAAALLGILAPALALLLLRDMPAPAPLYLFGGPVFALGLMGAGMITAATGRRLWIGIALALITGLALIQLARGLGMPALPHPFSTGLAVIVASTSFAARGLLFARAMAGKGWLMALFVVAGEAAILLTSLAMPDALPKWLLTLLPAQWASTAIQTALTGTGTRAASSALIALAGTAATTMLVARLWPRRWPYLLMFTAWLALSALVWHRPAPILPSQRRMADRLRRSQPRPPMLPPPARSPESNARSKNGPPLLSPTQPSAPATYC
jgi:hypothetical protein